MATQDKDMDVAKRAKEDFLNQGSIIDISYRLTWSHDWPWLYPEVYIKIAQELQAGRASKLPSGSMKEIRKSQ